MSQTLSTTIKGISLDRSLLVAVLAKLPAQAFAKADFARALTDAGFAHASDNDLVRRVMQFLKRQGLIDFDATNGSWSLTAPGQMRLPHKTLPLLPAPSQQTYPVLRPDKLDQWAEHLRLIVGTVACGILIIALIGLNASFAWELGREALQFQLLFTMGVMALDLMRPFLVAASFALLAQGRFAKALMGLAVAFMLSPVSVLSSTAILSSSFLLGAKMNVDEQVQTATLETLRGEHTRRLAEAERLNDAWRIECDRGGCGPLAAEIEATFLSAQAEAQAVLQRIEELTDATQGASDLLARMVMTFERLGLFGQGREILLPLFLAISLELGALFGPALLLGRRRSTP